MSKLGIVEQIDKLMPMTKGAKTTYGQRVFASILNGLGFLDTRLYLFPKFLATKPVAKLLGPDMDCNFFNDDSIDKMS